jgi:hypothetical protein
MHARKTIMLAAAAMIAVPAFAESGWRAIGHAQAAAGAVSVTISARESGTYREFIVCLDGGPARLTDAIVHYRDNRVQTYRLRARLADGGCSRAVSLSGRDHAIASLDIGYDPASLQGAGPRLELSVR